jgi:hypothetical protein
MCARTGTITERGTIRVKRTCPICQAPCLPRAENPAYPFCSHRCQLVDLGRWLNGDYHIPGEPAPNGDHGGQSPDHDEDWP